MENEGNASVAVTDSTSVALSNAQSPPVSASKKSQKKPKFSESQLYDWILEPYGAHDPDDKWPGNGGFRAKERPRLHHNMNYPNMKHRTGAAREGYDRRHYVGGMAYKFSEITVESIALENDTRAEPEVPFEYNSADPREGFDFQEFYSEKSPFAHGFDHIESIVPRAGKVNFAEVRKYIDSLCRHGINTEVKLNMIYHQAKFNRDVAVDAQQQLQEYAERIRTLEEELDEARESLQISQGKQA